MSDDKVILTAAEAESLLADGDTVHSFINPRNAVLVGYEYDRAHAIAGLHAAKQVELAGDAAKALKHPLAVWDDLGVSFFEADMDKVAAFEVARMPPTQD